MEMVAHEVTSDELNEDLGYESKDNLSIKKQKEYERKAKKYIVKEKLIIARVARKTLAYIEKNVYNFPNIYKDLKSRIIQTNYDILEQVYRANATQKVEDKTEIIVKIAMLNYLLSDALNKELITYKKFESYTKYLIELDSMVRGWLKYEKTEWYISQSIWNR